MNHGFGHEVPQRHAPHELRQVTRYLIVIAAGGVQVARLYRDDREQVAEFDAGTEEVATMVRGLAATASAGGAEWDRALSGHNDAERAAASVYVLDV